MNYSMQGMTKAILELFVMLKSTKVEIKKVHQVLMVDKITSFKKGELQVEWQASCHSREEAQSWTKAWNWVITLQRKWSLEAEMPWIFGG